MGESAEKPTCVVHWENGMTMVFNNSGEQIPELQKPWFRIYLEWLESKGVEPSEIQFNLPDQNAYKAKKMADGYYVWERECPRP